MFNRNPPVTITKTDLSTVFKPDPPAPSNDVTPSGKFIWRSPNRVKQLENLKRFSAENGLGRGEK